MEIRGRFPLVGFLFLCMMLASPLTRSSEIFQGRVYPVGEESFGIDSADLNGDGHLDIVTANLNTFYFSILFGNGDGTFAPETRIPTERRNHAEVVLRDLDNDGDQDVVLPEITSVSIFMGHGDGTFDAEILLYHDSGGVFTAAAVGDFNGDTLPDIVTGDLTFDNTIFLSNGEGGYEPRNFGVGANCFALTGYFNDDEFLDLVGGNCVHDGVTVWPGQGDGSFAQGFSIPVGSTARDAVADDFDGDGRQDLAVVNSDQVSVLLQTDDNQFAAEVTYDALYFGRRISLADLNNDGRNDLVVSTWEITADRTVAVLLSNGDGTFASPTFHKTPVVGGEATVGDFNEDGHQDVACASLWASTGFQLGAKGAVPEPDGLVFVMFGDGEGDLIGSSADRFSVGERAIDIVVADWNADGYQDLATVNFHSADVSIGLGTSEGGFVETSRYSVGASPRAIVTGLLNSDSALDLAVANSGSSDVSILLGNGDGTFSANDGIPVAGTPMSIVQADLNGDSVLDLATANSDTDSVSVLLGLGDGEFDVMTPLPVGQEPTALAAADLDGANGVDLITANVGSQDLSTLMNLDDQGFDTDVRWQPGAGHPRGVASEDLNGDGNPDVIVRTFDANNSVFVLHGNGDGSFSSPQSIPVNAGVLDFAFADIDGDGAHDIITSHQLPMVTVLLATDDGFAAPREYAADHQGRLAVAELDQDGLLDIVVTDWSFKRVAVLHSQLPIYVRFLSRESFRWPKLVGFDSFNIYRGSLADLRDLDGDGASDSGYGSCRNDLDPDLTDTAFIDTETPLTGEGYFFLMERVRDGVASEIGSSSSGEPRVPAVSCLSSNVKREPGSRIAR